MDNRTAPLPLDQRMAGIVLGTMQRRPGWREESWGDLANAITRELQSAGYDRIRTETQWGVEYPTPAQTDVWIATDEADARERAGADPRYRLVWRERRNNLAGPWMAWNRRADLGAES